MNAKYSVNTLKPCVGGGLAIEAHFEKGLSMEALRKLLESIAQCLEKLGVARFSTREVRSRCIQAGGYTCTASKRLTGRAGRLPARPPVHILIKSVMLPTSFGTQQVAVSWLVRLLRSRDRPPRKAVRKGKGNKPAFLG